MPIFNCRCFHGPAISSPSMQGPPSAPCLGQMEHQEGPSPWKRGGLHASKAAAQLRELPSPRHCDADEGVLVFFYVPKQGLIIQATELELREAAKLNETGST